ncbi:MAG: O-antigen ligase family protein [Cyclobacteriaceae bacterium]
MLTGGRTSFISLILIFSFFILRFFLEDRGNVQKLTFGFIVTMTICMFATSAYEKDSRALILNDSWDRYDLWESAISANTNILFGVGTGDYKSVLNEYFRSHNMGKYAVDSLNAHNQFIQTYLSNGLLGLVAIIILLGRPLLLSFLRGNTLGILVFFPFVLYGMTEVFLGRYQGVVFFAFLHQVFMAHLESSKPTINLKHP